MVTAMSWRSTTSRLCRSTTSKSGLAESCPACKASAATGSEAIVNATRPSSDVIASKRSRASRSALTTAPRSSLPKRRHSTRNPIPATTTAANSPADKSRRQLTRLSENREGLGDCTRSGGYRNGLHLRDRVVTHSLPLKAALKRGALVAAANWPLVVVQFIAESMLKLLLAVPTIGGLFLVVLL